MTHSNENVNEKFQNDYQLFEKLGGTITHTRPFLNEFNTQNGGNLDGHYFHQDLLVASFINKKSPKRHIDIGSSIYGFVSHVASFRQIETFDIRAMHDFGHKNIKSVQQDVMNRNGLEKECADSISCLHAIEHFGLGRYGDPIDPNGHLKGFDNLVYMLAPGGTLYISFPIARQNEVHFNAHRCFHPKDILNWTESSKELRLERFDFIDDSTKLHLNVDLQKTIPQCDYGCGIYSFVKKRKKFTVFGI